MSDGTASESAATVTSASHDFVVWGTQRRPWKQFVQIDGDADYAGRVLDNIKVF